MREWLGRRALRAYPREVARSQGEEMLSTMLDVGAESRLVFALDLISLLVGGLRERTRGVAQNGTRQLVTDACRLTLIVYLMVLIWDRLPRLMGPGGIGRLAVALVVCVSLPLLLVGYTRAAGTIGLFAGAVGVWITIGRGQPAFIDVLNPLVTMAVPAVCCAILIADRSRRPLQLRRLTWLLVPVTLAIVLPPSPFNGGILGLSYQGAFLVLVSVIGMLRLPYDPRLALGCALIWASIALRIVYGEIGFGTRFTDTTVLWVAAFTLSAAVTRLVLMRRTRSA